MKRFASFLFVLCTCIDASSVRHRRQFEEFGQILDQGLQDLQNFPNQINDLVDFPNQINELVNIDNVGQIWNDNFNGFDAIYMFLVINDFVNLFRITKVVYTYI